MLPGAQSQGTLLLIPRPLADLLRKQRSAVQWARRRPQLAASARSPGEGLSIRVASRREPPAPRIEDFEIDDKSCLDRGNGKSRHIHVDPFLQHFQLLFTTLTLCLISSRQCYSGCMPQSHAVILSKLGISWHVFWLWFLQISSVSLAGMAQLSYAVLNTQWSPVLTCPVGAPITCSVSLLKTLNHLSLSKRSRWLYIAKQC